MDKHVIRDTPPTQDITTFYDRIGKRYDWFETFEGRAKRRAMQRLSLASGMHVLNIGVGTGKEHARITELIQPKGIAFGVDVSCEMLRLTQVRTGAPLCQADARRLPYEAGSFERVYAAYVLDLIPFPDIPGILREIYHTLKPAGRLVLVCMTEGVDKPSRALVSAWKLAYKISPIACGGCRPLQLAPVVEKAGFHLVSHEVITQMALPSELIAAVKPE